MQPYSGLGEVCIGKHVESLVIAAEGYFHIPDDIANQQHHSTERKQPKIYINPLIL